MFNLEKKYRDWREEVKKSYFLKYENDEDRLCNAPPPRVSPVDWAQLVANYNIEEYKATMLVPPVSLAVGPGGGVGVVQGDAVGVEEFEESMEEEALEEEADSEEQSSCTSVNTDEIIETPRVAPAPAPAEELNHMEREIEEINRKLEAFKSRFGTVSANTQREGNGGASGSQGPAK